MLNPKISVIIPTYNRYKSLLHAIDSVKKQTYKNIEIIVINDNSTDSDYYSKKINNVIIIHLNKNSKYIYKYSSAGYVRNFGLKIATGKYIAFLDDDDYYLPNKIESQVKYLESQNKIHICSTDAYIGNGIYDKNKIYKIFNKEYFWNFLKHKLNLIYDYPNIWNLNFISKHNTIITSSVMFRYKLLSSIGFMKCLPNGYEDYDYWIRILQFTDCYYINKPLIYYDSTSTT